MDKDSNASAFPCGSGPREPSPSVPDAAPSLHDEMVSAIYQYHSDLRRPPTPDSVQRRLVWVEKIIAKIQQEALQ